MQRSKETLEGVNRDLDSASSKLKTMNRRANWFWFF